MDFEFVVEFDSVLKLACLGIDTVLKYADFALGFDSNLVSSDTGILCLTALDSSLYFHEHFTHSYLGHSL